MTTLCVLIGRTSLTATESASHKEYYPHATFNQKVVVTALL